MYFAIGKAKIPNLKELQQRFLPAYLLRKLYSIDFFPENRYIV